ncbi:MAG TPA: hypothetical protein VM939_10865 [Gemmatimonadaceae bacterium]|nr:hypothetical protein [Gemmatimonadaceae bacterium]
MKHYTTVFGTLMCSLLLTACGNDDAATSDTTAASTPSSEGSATTPIVSPTDAGATTGPLTITTADLDGFEKGLAREIELVKAAKDRASKATDAQARGEAIQAAFEQNTMAQAAPVTGLSPERYVLVRQRLHELIQTLDFQGKIEGPMSLDTARADAASKARLTSDPYAALDPAGAAALRSRLDRIVPKWVEYVNLTVAGG